MSAEPKDEIITELVPIEDIDSAALITLGNEVEKRVEAMNKIKRAALTLTNPKDWCDQSGTPYLMVSGAEKIARMFGVGWKILEPIKEKLEGGHFSFTYTGTFTLAGNSITAVGTRSSQDPFFKRYAYPDGVKTELPVSAIDCGDVKKAAYTNCIGNGITRIIGLRNLSYDDLQAFAGFGKEQVAKVEYKKGGQTSKPDQAQKADEASEKTTIGVKEVKRRTGTSAKSGKAWVQFIVIDGSGIEYKTYSETLAQKAKDAHENGLEALIIFKKTQYGNDLLEVHPIMPEV